MKAHKRNSRATGLLIGLCFALAGLADREALAQDVGIVPVDGAFQQGFVEALPRPTLEVVASAEAPIKNKAVFENAENVNRKTVGRFWRDQLKRSGSLSYPVLRLNAKSKAGDVGVGDREQFFVIVQSLSVNEYLMREWQASSSAEEQPVFVFRNFDYSNIPLGSRLPAPQLAEIRKPISVTDEFGAKRQALIVQPMMPSELMIPSRESLLTERKSAERTSKKVTSETAGNQTPPAKKPSSEPAKPTAGSEKSESTSPSDPLAKRLGEQPRFVERRWRTANGKHSAMGKLVGVGKDAVWIKIRGSKVVRMELNELHRDDRDHALAKKQAILDYRQRKAMLGVER